MVSTDDEEIGAVAREFGAEAPYVRPAELANDHASTVPVIKHAVEWVDARIGKVDYACCIYATAPFVQASAIAAACEILIAEKIGGYVFTATTFPFPIQRAFKINSTGYVEMFEPKHYNARSQDLEEAYQDAGQFYWGSAATYRADKIFFSNDSKAFVLPRHMVQDIDTPEDWKRAELMYSMLKSSGDVV